MTAPLDSHNTAVRLHSTITKIVQRTIRKERPLPRYGTVMSTPDASTNKVQVRIGRDTGNTPVTCARTLVPSIGSVVRVEGQDTDLLVTAVLSGSLLPTTFPNEALAGVQPLGAVVTLSAPTTSGYKPGLYVSNGTSWFPVGYTGALVNLDGPGSGGRISGGSALSPQTLHTPSPTSLTAPAWASSAQVIVLLSGIYTDTAAGNNFQVRLSLGPSTSTGYRRTPEPLATGSRYCMMWIDTLAITPGVANSLLVQGWRVSGTGGLNCDATAAEASFAITWLP
jgi:hypothetical protein